jgi:hypothetical protein
MLSCLQFASKMHSILTSSQGAEFSKDLFLPKSVWFPHSIPGLNVSIPDLSLKTKAVALLVRCLQEIQESFSNSTNQWDFKKELPISVIIIIIQGY